MKVPELWPGLVSAVMVMEDFAFEREKKLDSLPKLDGDWANIDELLFNPLDPIRIDDVCCCCWMAAAGGRINNADELVGTMLT